MVIVEESVGHRFGVGAVNRAAFAGEDEAGLVERLRADGLVRLSLVAVDGGEVIGHVLFTALPVEVDGRAVDALALAPLAVRPDRQGEGIGSRLMEAGLVELKRRGHGAVIVVGHPGYYPRFGFSADLARKLASPFPGEAFMALELIAGALAGKAGAVRYPPAFGLEAGAG